MSGICERLRLLLHVIRMRRGVALTVAWGVCLLGWPVVLLMAGPDDSRAWRSTGVLVTGVAAGIGAAVVLGRWQATFATAAQLERSIELPVIGTIGEVATRARSDRRARRRTLFAAGVVALGIAYLATLGIEIIRRGTMT